jgi:sirohydrochlorin cobaltochelatase
MRTAIILFGHGSREPQWLEPFQRLANRVRQNCPRLEVRLAFLELMSPDLATAVAQLAALGTQLIRIVPVFIGQGAHVRSDLPKVVENLRRQYPEITLQCVSAVGDDNRVLEALAEYSLRDLP